MAEIEREDPVDFKLRQEKTLNQLDSAAFSWFHYRILIVNGVGFFTVNIPYSNEDYQFRYIYFNSLFITSLLKDAYDIFVM